MSPAPRVSVAAVVTLGLGLLQAAALVASWVGLVHVGILPVGVLGAVSLAVGTLALVGIRKSDGRRTGTGLALAGMAISLLSFLGLLGLLWTITMMER